MKKLLLIVLLLPACAGMEEAYRDQTCHREVGYERGVNDGQAGKLMDSSFGAGCDAGSRYEVMNGYREGYESVRNRASFEADDGGVVVKGPGVDIRLGKAKLQSWACEVEAFGQTFTGIGKNQAEATLAARNACGNRYNAMHCDEVRCQENR